MANFEVLSLDPTTPQIRAPGAGDGYSVPRDMTVASGANLTLSGGTANGVLYLNGSKVATSGSALTFDGTNFATSGSINAGSAKFLAFSASAPSSSNFALYGDGTTTVLNGPSGGVVQFNINNSEQMRLTTTGLGIGTTSPAGKLTVKTGTNENLTVLTGGSGDMRLSALNDAASATVQLSIQGSPLYFRGVGGAINATLDSSGNLGLGVTPSASSAKTIEVGAVGNSLIGRGASLFDMTANAYFNSGYKYAGTGLATLYQQYIGTHAWFTAPSGTAGNTITFTQAMTLDASGNLGIGTSSPQARLDVSAPLSSNGPTIRLSSTGTTASSGQQIGAVDFYNSDADIPGVAAYVRALAGQSFGVGGTLIFGTQATYPSGVLSERARVTGDGYFKASDAGTYISVTGAYHEFRSTNNTYTVYTTNTNASPLGTVIEYTNASPNGTGNVFLFCGDSTTTRATIRSNGGLANYQANDVNLSDERVKTDIAPVGSYWDKIKNIEIVTFKYKDQTHDDNNIGVIAQQVESVAPEFIDADGFGKTPEDGVPLKTVYTTDLYHAAIKALQEAMARIEQLETKVAALEAR